MQIKRYLEHEIPTELHAAIEALRNACFPEHQQNRSYGKQFPHFRLLALEDGNLVGQLGVDHRAMRFGDRVHSVFGVIDLCVREEKRGRGIGGRLLTELKSCAQEGEVDLLLLLADQPDLYQKHGFHGIDAKCQWLGIDDHRNLGVMEETIEGELMIQWIRIENDPTGPIDFLGYLF